MSDDLTWTEKLNHIRFSRLVLFLEKWMSLILLCLMLCAGFKWPIISIVSCLMLGLFVLNYSNHFLLEETGGMPVQKLTMRY